MKKLIAYFTLVISGALLCFTSVSLGQSTSFFSNLGQTPVGSLPIGNNAWCATDFITSLNSSGYLLNSVQLRLDTPTGTPSGLTVAIYDRSSINGIQIGGLLETLSGAAPSGSGVFTFQSAGLALGPSRLYYLVATAATPVASGSYRWDITPWLQPPPDSSPELFGARPSIYQSADGFSWNITRGNNFMFAINATAVPEPSSLVLLCLGGSFLFTRLARKSRSKTLSQP